MPQLRLAALGAVAIAGLGLAACQPGAGKAGASTSASCGESTAAPPAAPGTLQVAPLKWTCRKLANGLRVYAMPDANTASASVAVWYDVGSKNDPAGRSGFAHLFEHLMFKSTANMPAENFDRLTEDVGGFNNASTTDDYTDYYETVPANHLQRVLWAESERMGALVVNDGDMLERLTNHLLPSTIHRVRNPDASRAAFSRYSMPFFLHLRSDFPIKTLPQCITVQNPDRYPEPILADAFLQQRLREIGLKK